MGLIALAAIPWLIFQFWKEPKSASRPVVGLFLWEDVVVRKPTTRRSFLSLALEIIAIVLIAVLLSDIEFLRESMPAVRSNDPVIQSILAISVLIICTIRWGTARRT